MKIHTKLLLSLIACLIIVVVLAQALQYFRTTGLISDFASSNLQIMKEREEGFARNIYRSVERSVAGSLERGEMEKFTKLLEAQREVEGLLEFSLYSKEGEVTHSSDQAFINKRLPEEYSERLLNSPEMLFLWKSDAIEIFQPQKINGDCIRCHMDWTDGGIGGVTGLRFSTAALNSAKSQADSTIMEMKKSSIFISLISVILIVIILSAVMYMLIRRLVSRPLETSVDMLKDIAEGEGDLTKRLKVITNDEVGQMSEWFNIFIGKIQDMIIDISKNANTLSTSSSELTSISEQMNTGVEQTSMKSDTVASAAEDMSTNMNNIAASMEQASASINTVATSTEEMTSTINEIATNSEKAHSITDEAVSEALGASENVDKLGRAAQEIGKVTEAITEISEQTNLLALNATIEAARAGDAGKGFAVVANEIKELARQTTEAAQEIKDKVKGIRVSTDGTVHKIEKISVVINQVNDIVSVITTSVDEQLQTTREIADSISHTSSGIQEVNNSVTQSSMVADEIAKDIKEVNDASNDMSGSCSQVHTNAEKLNSLAGQLKDMVERFKV